MEVSDTEGEVWDDGEMEVWDNEVGQVVVSACEDEVLVPEEFWEDDHRHGSEED